MMDQDPRQPPIAIPKSGYRLLLNAAILVLSGLVVYFSYTYFARGSSSTPAGNSPPVKSQKVLQMDVLNGCGVKGAGAKVTSLLRSNGFDVVEMKNFKTFNVPQSLVIDRIGDISSARRVAAALGISEKNIVQQLNPDYFVDVSVIIGLDYNSLRTLHQ